ncbi:uncharacterized protein LOC114371566 [Glycine soja]|uniref:uncharacterized protein LOC114371566 n=1 Tax=Glycine soja TaxID=3848 RepID=UPI0010387957|nr:uncharacterized protein LOC114371566 [Glycine soja]
MFVLLIHHCCTCKCKGHWQLIVLCPKKNTVVWFCSLRRRVDVHIKAAINNAFNTLETKSEGKFGHSTPRWIEVKSHVQSGTYECGYYVMHWMWNIIVGQLKTNWTLWFNDGTPLDINIMTTLRKKWAEYFVKLRSIQLNETAKNFGDEKQNPSGEDDVAADGNKENPTNEAEQKEPENKKFNLEFENSCDYSIVSHRRNSQLA